MNKILEIVGDGETVNLPYKPQKINLVGLEGRTFTIPNLKNNLTISGLNLYLGKDEQNSEWEKDLAKAFKKGNVTIGTLNLRIDRISDKGAKALAKALENNTTLKRVNLHVKLLPDNNKKWTYDRERLRRGN